MATATVTGCKRRGREPRARAQLYYYLHTYNSATGIYKRLMEVTIAKCGYFTETMFVLSLQRQL